jgi:ubiquitin-protein ligase/uncharacterized Zn-finger protein
MSALHERREQDLKKLKKLEEITGGKVKVLKTSGHPINELQLQLAYRTAASTSYPHSVQGINLLKISLPAKYPLSGHPPTAIITTPIIHPNIYKSGLICLGQQESVTAGLDLLVRRIVQIITFDPTVLNENSPANAEALSWYQKTKKLYPKNFPSDQLSLFAPSSKPTISWNNVSNHPNDHPNPWARSAAPQEKVVVACPFCKSKLSLPTGRSGMVQCPLCKQRFEIST